MDKDRHKLDYEASFLAERNHKTFDFSIIYEMTVGRSNQRIKIPGLSRSSFNSERSKSTLHQSFLFDPFQLTSRLRDANFSLNSGINRRPWIKVYDK